MKDKVNLYEGNINRIVKRKKPEEVMELLVDAVNRDMEEYFYIGIETLQRFEEVDSVYGWVTGYRDYLDSNLSDSIREFLYDNGYDIDDLMVDAKSIFEELIEEAREMFPDEEEE
jgi:hypothetical protein